VRDELDRDSVEEHRYKDFSVADHQEPRARWGNGSGRSTGHGAECPLFKQMGVISELAQATRTEPAHETTLHMEEARVNAWLLLDACVLVWYNVAGQWEDMKLLSGGAHAARPLKVRTSLDERCAALCKCECILITQEAVRRSHGHAERAVTFVTHQQDCQRACGYAKAAPLCFGRDHSARARDHNLWPTVRFGGALNVHSDLDDMVKGHLRAVMQVLQALPPTLEVLSFAGSWSQVPWPGRSCRAMLHELMSLNYLRAVIWPKFNPQTADATLSESTLPATASFERSCPQQLRCRRKSGQLVKRKCCKHSPEALDAALGVLT
jgi:hypothetical protein